MIGNDIVDYSVDEKKYKNHRYVVRTLNEIESKYLGGSKQKNHFFWSLWAAKEAAYKAIQRYQIDLIFSPPLFVINEDSLNRLTRHDFKSLFTGKLQFKDTRVSFQLNHLSECVVHCVAAHDRHSLGQCLTSTEQNELAVDYPSQSHLVRSLADKLLSANNIKADIERPEIEIKQNKQQYSKPGPPILIDTNTRAQRSDVISLSHDNQWLAAVILKK